MIKDLTSSLISKSGGLFYHYLALKHKNNLWMDYKNLLNKYLKALNIPSQNLVLIGPSGAYTLDINWINQFASIMVAEPDILAKKILRQKIKEFKSIPSPIGLNLSKQNIIPKFALENTFVYCNILGQLYSIYHDFGGDCSRFQSWKKELSLQIQSSNFVSFHDVYSFQSNQKINANIFENCRTISDCINKLKCDYGKKQSLTLIDHQSIDLFENKADAKYLLWAMTSNQYHIIELVSGFKV